MHSDLLSLLRPHYRSLQGYVSAGMEADKSADLVFLNANENPYELPGLEGYSRYPEPQPKALRDAYADLYDIEAGRIVMTRGADEAIAVLTKLFCEPGADQIMICPPTFGMYGVNAATMPAGVVSVPLRQETGTFHLDCESMVNRLDACKLVFLCSPNNPTGGSFRAEDLTTVIEAARGRALVVLDETYIEFAEAESFTRALSTTPHLVILRTLSKSYALAGMRMGSMLCGNTQLAALVREKGLDAYPLPQASVDAALHVTKPAIQAQARENINRIVRERDRVAAQLKAHPSVTHVYPSDANFLLVTLPKARAFVQACAAQGIIIRDFSGKEETRECVRLSIGRPAENDRVLAILDQL